MCETEKKNTDLLFTISINMAPVIQGNDVEVINEERNLGIMHCLRCLSGHVHLVRSKIKLEASLLVP